MADDQYDGEVISVPSENLSAVIPWELRNEEDGGTAVVPVEPRTLVLNYESRTVEVASK